MKFSLWPFPTNPVAEVVATAVAADAGGWHTVWFADHYMPDTRSVEVADGDMLEGWSVLAAMAAVTSRVRIGPLVTPTTVHHPALLANRAATIDQLSGGRFTLGLGAGWQVNEHHAYGIELPAAKARVDRFEESIEIVKSLLAGGRTTFRGTHFTISDAPCQPGPVQSPLPIVVGTPGPRMMRIAARHATGWNTWGDPVQAAAKAADLAVACASVGRDPATMSRSVQAMVHITDDREDAAARRAALPGRVLAGSVGELVETIGSYRQAGFEEFILNDSTLGATLAERLAGTDRFWTEIATPLLTA